MRNGSTVANKRNSCPSGKVLPVVGRTTESPKLIVFGEPCHYAIPSRGSPRLCAVHVDVLDTDPFR
jgi:hypothetical protein